jgi:nitrogen regulatory protein P-II 1
MKKIEAIIQPFKMEPVKEALKAIGIDGMTLTEVRGHGRQKGHKEVYRGQEYNVDLLPKMKIELVVSDARLEEVLRTLTTAARTGKIGDGKVFVYDVAEAIRIRNDDRGEAALRSISRSGKRGRSIWRSRFGRAPLCWPLVATGGGNCSPIPISICCCYSPATKQRPA